MEGDIVWTVVMVIVVAREEDPGSVEKILTEVVWETVAELPPKVPDGLAGLKIK